MMRSKIHFTAALVSAFGIALTACGSSDASGARSSGHADIVTIRLGTVEGKSAPYADEVEHFASSVESLSNGSLRVEVVWEAAGPSDAQSEKALAALVGKGGIDLAVVPSRVWDQLGVTTLQALQTAFLVDGMALVNGIAESNIAGEVMAGLDAVGVEGLSLWPDSLRHPVSFGAPLVTADGFRGAQLRVPMSDLSYEIVRTMGADPVDPPDWTAVVASGDMDGTAEVVGVPGDQTAALRRASRDELKQRFGYSAKTYVIDDHVMISSNDTTEALHAEAAR